VDVLTVCFRHEPSNDPARMQMFRQREYVRIGDPASVRAHRDLWLERGQQMLRDVQLPVHADIANDPFFGRAGKLLAVSQRDQALKFELLVPICSEEKPTACVSCNYHEDHFGHAFDIRLADGSSAHTACVGFGLERITLALFRWHGFDVSAWPSGVRKTLGF
jgi:seryl-tRNA synthetase